MIKQVWLNLSSKDLTRAREFYTAIGFTVNEKHSNATMLAVNAGEKNLPIMIFDEKTFAHVMQQEINDATRFSEVLISFDAESRDEVEEMAEKVRAAGGNIFAPPAELQGWMYNCGFTDPDGHRWNVLFMDMSQQPKGLN